MAELSQGKGIKILSVGTQGPAGPKGDKGAQGNPFAQLVTTSLMPIIDNECKLPSQPIGDLAFNLAMVFTEQDGRYLMEEHDQIMIIPDVEKIRFLDAEYDFSGKYAVVSYLAKIL